MSLAPEKVGVVMYGTYPANTITDAVNVIAGEVGPYFDQAMPNGEVDPDKIDWHKRKMANAGRHEGVRTIKEGSLTSLVKAPQYALEEGYDQLPTEGGLGVTYYTDAKNTIDEFEAARNAKGLFHLRMQLDWAGTLDDPALWFGLNTLFRGIKGGASQRSVQGFWAGIREFDYAYNQPFRQVTKEHVDRIEADEALRGKLLHQISAPIGHTLVSGLYKFGASQRLKAAAVEYATDTVADQISDQPVTWETAVHACLTDLNGASPPFITPNPKKAAAMEASVVYANTLLEKWPEGHKPPAYVGIPATTNIRPASTNEEFYAPLQDLRLPPETRLAMGIVHRELSLDNHKRIVDIIRNVYSGPLSFSQPCGAGRLRQDILGAKEKDAAIRTLRLTRQVIEYANS